MESEPMDAMIGRIEATQGNRDALAEALVLEAGPMPGCLTYMVATKPGDPLGVWIAEAWESREAHEAWLESEATRALVARVGPWMVGYEQRHELTPVGGLPSIFGPAGLAS